LQVFFAVACANSNSHHTTPPHKKHQQNSASLLASTARALPNFEKKLGPVNIGLINAGAIRADIEVCFFC
jgi:hypothetical protein